MNCPLLQRSPWYCTLFLTAFLSEKMAYFDHVQEGDINLGLGTRGDIGE